MATIYQGKYFLVQHFLASIHVRVIRTAAPFESVSEATDALSACKRALTAAGVDWTAYGVMFDWREAPLSTDPQLHKTLVTHLDAMAAPFRRRAFLVRTGVGSMQAGRLGRTASSNAMDVFSDEDEAVTFLTRPR